MDQKLLHELAISYAQARLTRKQIDAENCHSEDELYDFIHDYQFALTHTNEQLKRLPKV